MDLLEEAEDLLQICCTLLGRTSCTNIWSKWKYSKKLSDLTNRIKECVLEDAALAALPKMEAVRIVLLKHFEKTDALSKKIEDLAEIYEGSSLEHRNLLQAMNEEYKKLLHDTLASKLKTLSDKTGRDRRCKVNLEIAELTDRPRQFHPPLDIVPCEPEPSAAPPDHRGTAVEGGYEVNNDTSVQFTFEVTFADTWFFYILCLDRTAEGSRPVIAFLACVGNEDDYNALRKSKVKRVFPRESRHGDDPRSLKLIRSNNAPANACHRVYLYLLIVSSCLTPDQKPNQAITIEDVDNFLTREELDSENVILEHFQFDIRLAQLQRNKFTSGTML